MRWAGCCLFCVFSERHNFTNMEEEQCGQSGGEGTHIFRECQHTNDQHDYRERELHLSDRAFAIPL